MAPDDLRELDDLYQDVILDHFRSPRHNGLLDNPDLKGEGYNPFCGDRVVLTAGLDGSERIQRVGIWGEGCAISQSSASIMGELLKGRTLDDAQALLSRFKQVMQGDTLSEAEEEVMGELAALEGVKKFPIRVKCALLAWTTLQDAITEHRKGQTG